MNATQRALFQMRVRNQSMKNTFVRRSHAIPKLFESTFLNRSGSSLGKSLLQRRGKKGKLQILPPIVLHALMEPTLLLVVSLELLYPLSVGNHAFPSNRNRMSFCLPTFHLRSIGGLAAAAGSERKKLFLTDGLMRGKRVGGRKLNFGKYRFQARKKRFSSAWKPGIFHARYFMPLPPFSKREGKCAYDSTPFGSAKKYKNQRVFCVVPPHLSNSLCFLCLRIPCSLHFGRKIIVSVFWYVGRAGGPRGKGKCGKRGQATGRANKNKSGRRESTRLAGQTGFFSRDIRRGRGKHWRRKGIRSPSLKYLRKFLMIGPGTQKKERIFFCNLPSFPTFSPQRPACTLFLYFERQEIK